MKKQVLASGEWLCTVKLYASNKQKTMVKNMLVNSNTIMSLNKTIYWREVAQPNIPQFCHDAESDWAMQACKH